jgi:hypothetical protein
MIFKEHAKAKTRGAPRPSARDLWALGGTHRSPACYGPSMRTRHRMSLGGPGVILATAPFARAKTGAFGGLWARRKLIAVRASRFRPVLVP